MENLPCILHENQCFYTGHLICFHRACASGSLIIILLISKLTLRILNSCALVRNRDMNAPDFCCPAPMGIRLQKRGVLNSRVSHRNCKSMGGDPLWVGTFVMARNTCYSTQTSTLGLLASSPQKLESDHRGDMCTALETANATEQGFSSPSPLPGSHG